MVPIAALAGGLALAACLALGKRRLVAAVLAGGILGGWVLGAGLRLAMFVAAEMGGGVERSVDGTVGLILFFAIPGVVLSVLARVVRTFTRFGPRGIAGLVTAICACFLAAPVREELFARGNGWVNILTFLLAAAAGGATIGRVQLAVEAWWDRRAARRAPSAEPAEPAAGTS